MAFDEVVKFRVDSGLWERAGKRASDEGVTRSALIRQWLEDYASAGVSAATSRAKVRLSAAERKALAEHLGARIDPMSLADTAIDVINLGR